MKSNIERERNVRCQRKPYCTLVNGMVNAEASIRFIAADKRDSLLIETERDATRRDET